MSLLFAEERKSLKIIRIKAATNRPSVQPERVRTELFFSCIYKGGQFTEDGSFIGQYVPGRPPVSAHSTPQNPSLQGGGGGAGANATGGNVATYV